jgi:hypothetical protein
MTTDQPRVNQSGFVAVLQNKVLAIVPVRRLDESTAALAEEGVDLARVDVLHGEIGAGILDFDGTEHGPWAHVVRTMQKLGTASNERANYAAALRNGEAVIIVPVHNDIEVDDYSRILDEHGGRRIIHFGKYTREQISY